MDVVAVVVDILLLGNSKTHENDIEANFLLNILISCILKALVDFYWFIRHLLFSRVEFNTQKFDSGLVFWFGLIVG